MQISKLSYPFYLILSLGLLTQTTSAYFLKKKKREPNHQQNLTGQGFKIHEKQPRWARKAEFLDGSMELFYRLRTLAIMQTNSKAYSAIGYRFSCKANAQSFYDNEFLDYTLVRFDVFVKASSVFGEKDRLFKFLLKVPAKAKGFYVPPYQTYFPKDSSAFVLTHPDDINFDWLFRQAKEEGQVAARATFASMSEEEKDVLKNDPFGSIALGIMDRQGLNFYGGERLKKH